MTTLAQLTRLTRGQTGVAPEIDLAALSLSSLTYDSSLTEGAFIADITGKTPGSSLTIAADDGQVKFNTAQTQLLKGPTPSSPGTLGLNIVETLFGAGGSPKTNSFSINVMSPGDAVLINMGALSRAGVGSGVYVGGSSITAGNSAGHFELITGILCVSAAGDAANLSFPSYSLTLNTGLVVLVTVEANTWSISTQAEWDFVIAQATGTLFGKTISLRALENGAAYVSGVNGTVARLRRADYGGLTIKSDNLNAKALIDKFYLRGTRNVTFSGLDTPETSETKFRLVGESANNVGGITITGNRIRGVPGDPHGNYVPANSYPNPDMITNAGSTGFVGTLTITNNEISWAGRAINISSRSGTRTTTSGNWIHHFYDDGINVSYDGANVPWYCEDNVISHPLGLSSDEEAPHCDHTRGAATIAATTDWEIHINRNRCFKGDARGGGGMLFSDFKSGGVDSGHFFVGEVIGNVVVIGNPNGLVVENAKSIVALNNTVVQGDTVGGAVTSLKFGIGSTDSTTSGTHRVQRNIAEALSAGGTPTMTDNVVLGAGGGSISYASVFDGPISMPDDVGTMMTQFARKNGGPADLAGGPPDAGAIASSAITWATTIPGNNGANLVS